MDKLEKLLSVNNEKSFKSISKQSRAYKSFEFLKGNKYQGESLDRYRKFYKLKTLNISILTIYQNEKIPKPMSDIMNLVRNKDFCYFSEVSLKKFNPFICGSGNLYEIDEGLYDMVISPKIYCGEFIDIFELNSSVEMVSELKIWFNCLQEQGYTHLWMDSDLEADFSNQEMVKSFKKQQFINSLV